MKTKYVLKRKVLIRFINLPVLVPQFFHSSKEIKNNGF